MIEGSSNRGDTIDFNEETGTISASTYSYEISSCGYCEYDEKETKVLYLKMKAYYNE
jgi:hypothetical protein